MLDRVTNIVFAVMWLALLAAIGVVAAKYALREVKPWHGRAKTVLALAVVFVAYFVWPTPYRRFTCVLPEDVEAPRQSRLSCLATTARENRLTGRVEVLLPSSTWSSTVGHWYEQEPPQDYEDEGW